MMFIFVIVIPVFVIQQIPRINIQRKQKILTAPQHNIAVRAPEKEVKLTNVARLSKALCSHLHFHVQRRSD